MVDQPQHPEGMKPFHWHTPYFKMGPFRIQFTLLHINGPFWTGEPSGLKNSFVWLPKFQRHEQMFGSYVTISRSVIFGLLSAGIDICDTRKECAV